MSEGTIDLLFYLTKAVEVIGIVIGLIVSYNLYREAREYFNDDKPRIRRE